MSRDTNNGALHAFVELPTAVLCLMLARRAERGLELRMETG